MPDVLATTTADVCELWLSRCLTALQACPESQPITATYVAAGSIAWDSCCGLLVVAPERVYRTSTFPIEGTTDYICEAYLTVVDIVILLLRCVSTVDDRGKAPEPATLNAEYGAVLTDAAVIWNAVNDELPEGWERANVDQAFIGAEGGCIGVETRLTIGLPQGVFCPDCERN